MEQKFTSNEVPLSELLNKAASGVLQLPDFQRGWVWDDDHIKSLLASISLSYPIGAVMTLRTGNPDVRFRPRPLQGVELAGPVEPELMLLDGQQRLTSLFLALRSSKPVPTRDSNGKEMYCHYYAKIDACISEAIDREEEGIISVPPNRQIRTDFGRKILLDLSSRTAEITEGYFPLEIVMDGRETRQWNVDYIRASGHLDEERFDKWNQFTETLIDPFSTYQVPTIELAKSTPKEAVCQVFEKVNTGGVSLTVFELLTATYAADDFNLREDWENRKQRFDEHPLLGQFEATYFLQVVTLLATYDAFRRNVTEGPDGYRVPAVSCKRKDILRLTLSDYRKWADVASEAAINTVPFFHSECIFASKDLPYASQLVPIAAILGVLAEDADNSTARERLRRWYWCGVFGEMYGQSTETRWANDLQEVVSWIKNDSAPPRTVQEAQFQDSRLLTLRTRISAAYKGVLALQMQQGAYGLRTGNVIDMYDYFEETIDMHRIFPKKWCVRHNIDSGLADCVVNKTAISAKTNRIIGNEAPSKYITRLEKKHRIDPVELDSRLRSHDIDVRALRQDDFGSFFKNRFERLVEQIEEVMGKSANRSDDKDDMQFADRDPEEVAAHVTKLIDRGESRYVEFKSTARMNLHTKKKDPEIEWSILKTIAGFMNADGGTLLVGVDDNGDIIGIEHDYRFVHAKNCDGWEQWLTSVMGTSLSEVAAAGLRISYAEFDKKTVAHIEVGRARGPLFATPPKGSRQQKEVFMVRVNNTTKELHGQDLLDYRAKRWGTIGRRGR